jgi:transcriptional regulator with XRE-family HTH domain
MRRKPLESLGAMVRERRGKRTLREVAAEMGVGAATLLRVESGRIPDVGTFGLICSWLDISPTVFLGGPPDAVAASPEAAGDVVVMSAHFRADHTPQPETITALAKMLLFAARSQPSNQDPMVDERS